MLKLSWGCEVVAYHVARGPVVNLFISCLMRGTSVENVSRLFWTRIVGSR